MEKVFDILGHLPYASLHLDACIVRYLFSCCGSQWFMLFLLWSEICYIFHTLWLSWADVIISPNKVKYMSLG